ncbi:hypothetical protein [Deinococcus sp. UYEF24]
MTETTSPPAVPTLSHWIDNRSVRASSGRTSLHMYVPEGMQFYTRGKVVTACWPEQAANGGEGRRVDLECPGSTR